MSGSDETMELEARIGVLEQRLERVEAVQAIQNLKSRYGELADARYDRMGMRDRETVDALAKELADLFTDDAVWDGGSALGVCRGRREIYERFREPTLRFSWHYFVKPHIVVEGDRARGRWDILAPCTSREGRALWMSGWEEDEYVRAEGVWRHSRMALHTVFLAPHELGWAPSK